MSNTLEGLFKEVYGPTIKNMKWATYEPYPEFKIGQLVSFKENLFLKDDFEPKYFTVEKIEAQPEYVSPFMTKHYWLKEAPGKWYHPKYLKNAENEHFHDTLENLVKE